MLNSAEYSLGVNGMNAKKSRDLACAKITTMQYQRSMELDTFLIVSVNLSEEDMEIKCGA